MNKKRISNKRGQQILGLSFGMIFSIFLIIFFILIAFIVIKQFLNIQNCTKIGIFVDSLKADVKKTWNSQIDSHTFKGFLPSKIMYVCIADLSMPLRGNFMNIGNSFTYFEGKEANLFFYPSGSACEIPYHNIPHIDVGKITKNRNPFCIEVLKGTIFITVEKDLNDPLVNLNSA